MKYLRHILKEIGYSISDFLRRICGSLSEDARILVIVSMLLVFTVGNLYFTISAIRNWGREDGIRQMPEIRHIDGLDMMNSPIGEDTINLIDSPVNIGLQRGDSINNEIFISNEERTRENRPC